MNYKKVICIDFDGVLHSYISGWKGEDVIVDPPTIGAIHWLRELLASDEFEPVIYSSRSKHPAGVAAMMKALKDWGLPPDELGELKFPTQKPAAWLTIDDRCIQFSGVFPSLDVMSNYKPWNKGGITPQQKLDAIEQIYDSIDWADKSSILSRVGGIKNILNADS